MQTYVAIIAGKAVMAFRAEDEAQGRAVIEEGGTRSDLRTLPGADGNPLWDGKSPLNMPVRLPAQHAEWSNLETRPSAMARSTWTPRTIRTIGNWICVYVPPIERQSETVSRSSRL